MRMNPYLDFGGNCAEAFAFYERDLGARVTAMMRFRDGPAADQVGPEQQDKVMHAELELAGSVLMGTDGEGCGQPAARVTGVHLVLNVAEPTEAERLFALLAEGGAIEVPIGETFWAKRFGMVVDRFGVPWMINSD